ncbi:hypothetical protein M9Y10_009954 [Tritrichomonas musculus]|uniref:Uncharacterized protein n=1 Tax=Tritrichomonas musculus TaxID=1915356 RepID=A0ABR2IQX3_9EUKA
MRTINSYTRHENNMINSFNSAINDGNEIMIDDLETKTSQLLLMTQTIDKALNTDENCRNALLESIDKTDLLMIKGNKFVSAIVNDQSYFGVFKIAFLVFTTLCSIYFGGKLALCFIIRNKK